MTRPAIDPADSPEVTGLLRAWGTGDRDALDRLLPTLHDELRRLARRYMRRERQRHTRQATALVNAAYLKLIDLREVRWQDRVHFFAMSAFNEAPATFETVDLRKARDWKVAKVGLLRERAA